MGVFGGPRVNDTDSFYDFVRKVNNDDNKGSGELIRRNLSEYLDFINGLNLDEVKILQIGNFYRSGLLYSFIGDDFTFERNSTATRVNKDGLIESVDINVPRIDYSTGEAKILIEGQATNLCTRSDPSSLQFSKNISFQENDWGIGLNNKMVFDNQNGTITSITGGFGQNSMGTIDTTKINRVSFYIKRQDGLKPIIGTVFDTLTTALSLNGKKQIDVFFQDVVSSSKFYYNYTEKEVSNGVWFMTFDFAATAGSPSRTMGFVKNDTNSNNVVEVSGIQVIELDNLYGNPPSLEGRELTSYIPTNGTIVTRVADNAYINNFTPKYNNRILNNKLSINDFSDFILPQQSTKYGFSFDDLIGVNTFDNFNINEVEYYDVVVDTTNFREGLKDDTTLSLFPSENNTVGSVRTLQDDSFDFDRNSTATRVNKEGLIESVGVNEMRVDYSTGEGSILIEPQRTNYIEYSEDLSTFSNINLTVTSNTSISPDGNLTADRLTETTDMGLHQIGTGGNNYNVAFYTFSLFINFKTTTRNIGIFPINSSSAGNNKGVIFDSNGNFIGIGGNTGTNPTFKVNQIGDYFHIQVTGEATSSALGGATIRLFDGMDDNYIGSVNEEIEVWGLQLEEGSYPTSYIPTNGTIQTRVKDVINKTNAENLIPSEGSVYVEYEKILNTENSRLLFSFNSGNIDNLLEIADGIGAGNLGRIILVIRIDGNFIETQFGESTPSASGKKKILMRYSSTGYSITINGVIVKSEEVNVDFSNKFSEIGICNRLGFIRSKTPLQNTKIFNRVLTDQEAINLTTI